jgi:hypothetical protein
MLFHLYSQRLQFLLVPIDLIMTLPERLDRLRPSVSRWHSPIPFPAATLRPSTRARLSSDAKIGGDGIPAECALF